MSRPLVVTDTVRIPARAFTVKAVRASGPGGQYVQKVATKIDLRVDLNAIEGLSEAARERLRTLARHRLDASGRLAVTSQRTRDQARNLEDARQKVRALVLAALVEPRPRRPTRRPATVDEARIAAKKRRAALKRWRARPEAE